MRRGKLVAEREEYLNLGVFFVFMVTTLIVGEC